MLNRLNMLRLPLVQGNSGRFNDVVYKEAKASPVKSNVIFFGGDCQVRRRSQNILVYKILNSNIFVGL